MNALNVISFFNHFNEVKLIYSTGVQDGIPAGKKSQETHQGFMDKKALAVFEPIKDQRN